MVSAVDAPTRLPPAAPFVSCALTVASFWFITCYEMVARGLLDAQPFLTRAQGCLIGIVAAVPPTAISLQLLGLSTWATATLAVAAVASGGLIGSTIGRGLAAGPRWLETFVVAAIAVVIGTLIAAALFPLGGEYVAPLADYVIGWLLSALLGYFLFALPGVVLGVVMARQSAPGAEFRAPRRTS